VATHQKSRYTPFLMISRDVHLSELANLVQLQKPYDPSRSSSHSSACGFVRQASIAFEYPSYKVYDNVLIVCRAIVAEVDEEKDTTIDYSEIKADPLGTIHY
jgi:hypothetical protein